MHCYDFEKGDTVPKYTLFVVDSNKKELIDKRSCAAFLVPQGKEKDSIFSTEHGHQELISQIKCSRLVVIVLGNGHLFSDVK